MNMDKIYELILNGYNLTYELLKSKGFSEETINKMVSQGLLVLEDGYYYANDVDNVYDYYKKHVKELNYDSQAFLLDTVIYLKPDHAGALFQKFFISLKLGDNQAAFDAFAAQYRINKNYLLKNDSKLYLYLLSKLVNVGMDLYQEIADITFDDIKIPYNDHRYKNKELHNKARQEVLKGNYETAVNMLYNKGDNNKLLFQELVFKTLLNRIVNTYRHGRNYKECILDGRYGDALYSMGLKDDLTDYEMLVKHLLEFLINPPEEVHVDYDHAVGLWEAIEANDFEGALALNRQYNHDKGIDDNDSAVSVLLNEIINMINQYAYYQDEEEQTVVEEPIIEEPEVVEEEPVAVQEETTEDNEDDHIIDKISFISELLDQGLSFEDALDHASYDEHTNGYITLLYAKEAYRNGSTSIGDKLMSIYNKSTTKDKENNKLFKNIQESKKFLPYRPSDLEITITIPKKLVRTK